MSHSRAWRRTTAWRTYRSGIGAALSSLSSLIQSGRMESVSSKASFPALFVLGCNRFRNVLICKYWNSSSEWGNDRPGMSLAST